VINGAHLIAICHLADLLDAVTALGKGAETLKRRYKNWRDTDGDSGRCRSRLAFIFFGFGGNCSGGSAVVAAIILRADCRPDGRQTIPVGADFGRLRFTACQRFGDTWTGNLREVEQVSQ